MTYVGTWEPAGQPPGAQGVHDSFSWSPGRLGFPEGLQPLAVPLSQLPVAQVEVEAAKMQVRRRKSEWRTEGSSSRLEGELQQLT